MNDAIYTASENASLRSALKIEGPKSALFQQMQDAEYVLRFMTLRQSWDRFSGSLSRSMDDFMFNHKDAEGEALDSLIKPFEEAISRATILWGSVAFQRWDGQRWRQQVLAGLYDAEMIAASLLTDEQASVLLTKQSQIVNNTRFLFSNTEFEEAVRLGTNTPSRIKYRIEKVHDMLIGLT